MATLAWSPDGRQLAVGCEDGELVVFDMETGEQLPESRGLRSLTDALAHRGAITAMDWADVSDRSLRTFASSDKSQPSAVFEDRAPRFLGDGAAIDNKASTDSVLAAADARGHVGLWWSGKVLLASVDVAEHLSDTERRLLVPVTEAQPEPAGICIEQVHLSPDFARLFLWIRFDGGGRGVSEHEATSGEHRMVALALPSLQRVSRDAFFLSRTIDRCNMILDGVLLAARQMTAEVGTELWSTFLLVLTYSHLGRERAVVEERDAYLRAQDGADGLAIRKVRARPAAAS
jgi:hypothetical protein